MGGKIDCYIDLSSLYSYIAFVQLQNERDTLASHNVDVEFHPVFLGAINAGSGNKPPWTLPAKAVYGKLDGQRSLQRVGLSHVRPPKDMMASGKTVLPLRALLFIKSRYPRETFEAAFRHLFHCFWTPPNAHLADPSTLTKALCDVPAGPESDARLFTLEEVEAVIQAAGTKEMKDLLRDKTQEALDHGAFGAPWLWVTNAAGVSEPFFGSDRFHFIYSFLGLPYQDVTLLQPKEGSQSKPKL